MYHGQYEKLTELATGPARQDDVLRAKADYFAHTGEVFEDDRSFESRMASFLEYYLFDWVLPAEGITSAQLFLDQALAAASPLEGEAMLGFVRTLHSLFEVVELTAAGVHVRDLFTNKVYEVHERRTLAGLGRGDLLEARLVPLGARRLFSQSFCYHPKGAKTQVETENPTPTAPAR